MLYSERTRLLRENLHTNEELGGEGGGSSWMSKEEEGFKGDSKSTSRKI